MEHAGEAQGRGSSGRCAVNTRRKRQSPTKNETPPPVTSRDPDVAGVAPRVATTVLDNLSVAVVVDSSRPVSKG